jgi:hypothetical protein
MKWKNGVAETTWTYVLRPGAGRGRGAVARSEPLPRRLVEIEEPFGNVGLVTGIGGLAEGDGPVMEPDGTLDAGVAVLRLVSGVVESLGERYEAIGAAAEAFEDIGEDEGIEGVGVDEENVGDVALEELAGEALVVVEHGVEVRERGGADLIGIGEVAAGHEAGVEIGEPPVGVFERDGGDAVAARGEEAFEGGPFGGIGAGVEKRVTEPEIAEAGLLHHGAPEDFAANDFVFELLERDFVEVVMGEGVIAEGEPGVDPLLEERGAGIAFAWDVNLAFVDEADGGDAGLFERVEEAVGDVLGGGEGLVATGVGEIVHRDGNGALRGKREVGEEQKKYYHETPKVPK